MPKRSFKTDKRRREIAKRKKREEKLQRKRTKPEGDEQDTSYLEYLYPGGIPADVAAEHGLLDNEDDDDDADDEASNDEE